MSTEEISEKFDLEGLKKLLKNYGFGDITIEYKMYNGDGKLITERTIKSFITKQAAFVAACFYYNSKCD